MNFLDMRTIVLGYALTSVISLIVTIVLWRRYRARFAGLGWWVADFAMQCAALVLLVLRGVIPEKFSMMGGDPMIIGGTILLYVGLERFAGKRGPQVHNLILFVAYYLLQIYFVYFNPNLAARNIIFSATLAIICAQCAWLLLVRNDGPLRPIARSTGWVFAGFGIISLARIVIDSIQPPGNDFFHSDVYDALVLLAYQVSFIVLTFSLSLMVNRRLLAILESDLAGRDQAESIIRLRLKLWEFAAAHPVEELMQTALDEIEALTGSLIGFYHFVEEDQRTLTLQAWSTRTRREFCTAQGEGMHYAIDQAGVWADCVRERRPIIHNDYASLENRRGLPAGHARLVRELVVPTLRDNRVVSVLGVGNKPAEYEASDVVLVSYIADLVWTIVTQKRADERIMDLNGRLEQLAMTDELTGLANRRAFFARGAEAIKRCARYGTHLALIMLDLDKFKDLNDEYGHDAGDRALACVARTLRGEVREVDVAARLGGEEFGVLLPNTGPADAKILAERLRVSLESAVAADQAAGCPRVTASLGVASFSERTPDIDSLLKNADIAMYQAKREGRNRVCIFE